ncbi:MAG: CysS/YqeB C-terminal domain-containing protein [Acidimicrobiales bacterium]
MTRLLAIMGSGETAPTMVKVHRALLEQVGGPAAGAVLLDTPYGFQENADLISARAVEYFDDSVGHAIEVASWRTPDDGAAVREQALDRIRRAAYVFAGPGSPTYALRVWRGSPLSDLLSDKLVRGGCVTFASAAVLTLGLVTVPVYEIYKVGETPRWEAGLDLLRAFGLRVAVIPHYDNAEGGNHDTRFCYLGERRLALLEAELPDDAFVLGVDEHTACLIDLDAGSASVLGNGVVTVRKAGASVEFPAGEVVGLDEVRAVGQNARRPRAAVTQRERAPSVTPERKPAGLLAEAERLSNTFDAAVDNRDVDAAVAAILELDRTIVDWSRDTLQSDEPDRAQSILRALVVRLGEVARTGIGDPAAVVAPFVDAVLEARAVARSGGDFATADALRDRLGAAGVEVHDSADGTTWELRSL